MFIYACTTEKNVGKTAWRYIMNVAAEEQMLHLWNVSSGHWNCDRAVTEPEHCQNTAEVVVH